MTKLSQEELEGIILELQYQTEHAAHSQPKIDAIADQAISAINSLTLKQVMEVIGEDEDRALRPAKSLVRNDLRAELRQSAERIWS